MQVKAALLSSLAYHPRLLVLDEPFSGLDPVVREDLISGLLETACETTILLSSHDLAEIESFASHIGYLDSGRLQFSEEMTSLTSRFREIEVTLETPVSVPDNPRWPTNWLRPGAAAGLVRFIETRFDSERTSSDIDRLFCDVRQVTVNPMPLRSIFIALARNGSKAV
jgi:ABC-2 type transport system ATP-binding protein